MQLIARKVAGILCGCGMFAVGGVAFSKAPPVVPMPQVVSTASGFAWADLKNAVGEQVGTANFARTSDGVKITLNMKGLPPGLHAVHLHAVGKCAPPDFQSAGPHFNPFNKGHGHRNPNGPHAGDLPNIMVTADGTGRLIYILPKEIVLADGPTAIRGPNNASIIIHAHADDDTTDPAGNAGARIACGVLLSE